MMDTNTEKNEALVLWDKKKLSSWLEEVFNKEGNIDQAAPILEKLFDFCFVKNPIQSEKESFSSLGKIKSAFLTKIKNEEKTLKKLCTQERLTLKMDVDIPHSYFVVLEEIQKATSFSFSEIARFLMVFGIVELQKDPSKFDALEKRFVSFFLSYFREKASHFNAKGIAFTNSMNAIVRQRAKETGSSLQIIVSVMLSLGFQELLQSANIDLPPLEFDKEDLAIEQGKSKLLEYKTKIFEETPHKFFYLARDFTAKNKFQRGMAKDIYNPFLDAGIIRKTTKVLKEDLKMIKPFERNLNFRQYQLMTYIFNLGLILVRQNTKLLENKEHALVLIERLYSEPTTNVEIFMSLEVEREVLSLYRKYNFKFRSGVFQYLCHLGIQQIVKN